jgi:uncharacterized protein YerC
MSSFMGGIGMKLSNCLNCGQLMIKKTSYFCDECFRAKAEDLEKIKKYLMENPGSTFMDIYKDTGVSLTTINDLIMDRRLQYQ